MPTTVHRIFNFSAGPAVLPVSVLEEAQRDLLTLPGIGMSVLEISHRSKPFDAIIATAEADIRELAGIPADYRVLFLQGGASLQFSMVPMNLLPTGGTADYIVTGVWSQKAVKEAKRHGTVHIAGTTEAGNFVACAAAGRARVLDRRRLRARDVEQHHLRDAVAGHARCRRRPARLRRLVGHLQPADRDGAVRPHLRWCTEEPRPVGCHPRHRPRRFGEALTWRRCRRC